MIIGFTCGAFDLLHPGHLVMFAECKNHCDYLIVGLHSDPSLNRPSKNRPIQTLLERYLQLDACKHVNSIIPYDTENDLVNLLSILKIDKRFVGGDYKPGNYLTGQEICNARDIEIVYTTRYHDYSSTELRNRL